MLAAWLCQVSPLSQSAADTNNHLTPCYNNSFIVLSDHSANIRPAESGPGMNAC